MNPSTIRNWEIVLLALQMEDAASKRVHTEDITLRCFALAPDAFSWLKHRNYPDKEVVRKDLGRLRDGNFGGNFVEGRAGVTRKDRDDDEVGVTDGWQLTSEGIEWLLANRNRIEEGLGVRTPKATRQDAQKLLQRVRQASMFAQYQSSPESFVPKLGELASLLRCRVDAEDRVWKSRFQSLRNNATLCGEEVILRFLDHCEALQDSIR
ncbi:MAG: hypothetical protein IT449_13300 [Phycisphaerales bacterium]|nr:hypothetical protein [Phycisphaerales bacterium]